MVLNVSHIYKTCYVHIPKTGGSSIEYILFNRYNTSEHCSIEYYKNYFGYYIFSIVRNPYMRIISVYNYYSKGGNQSESDKNIIKNTSLDDFLSRCKNKGHLKTQFSFLKNSDKKLDYIGKFENYKDEVKKYAKY